MDSNQLIPNEQISPAEDTDNTIATQNPAPEAAAASPAADETHEPAGDKAGGESVDFSDEEAMLAAESPEYDLGEADEHEEGGHDGAPGGDYSGVTKQGLLEEFRRLMETKPVQSLRRDVEAIKVAFYKLHRAEADAARRRFAEAGGNPEEFAPEADQAEAQLKELFAQYRRKRDAHIAELEQRKEENLKIKLKVIEDLKELINSSETLNTTFAAFRELQNRWKETGLVPQANMKDLWETYNLHVENFYGVIKMNKELRDLDLKRNYEAKVALCEEAEALLLEPSVIPAFHKLQKLHEQWRETGPVATEFKESLWERFREASSRINKQHQDHFEGQKEEQQRNFEMKSELCNKAEELASGIFTTRKEWNKASEQLVEIQKLWKTIGFAPKKENTKVYERFRNACDRFFAAKREFYMGMKSEMDENLTLKNEICAMAESLKDSEDWKGAADQIIDLQKKWKEIGPVPRRHADAVWKRFRAACDCFFDRKSAHFKDIDGEHEKNLVRKRELIAEMEAIDPKECSFDMIKDLQRRWGEVGFVPIKQKNEIQAQYKALMDKFFGAVRGSSNERRMDNFKGRVENMRKGGDRKLHTERDMLYNKVRQLESDIALLENNIGFFSKSKNAEALIKDVQDKIARAKEDMAITVEMVRVIDAQEQK